MATPRHLVLVRHGKAEPFGATDRDRALTPRGRREAAETAEFLRARGLVPDHAVVSSAVRARETWQAMEESLGSGASVVHDDAVYSAGTETVLESLGVVPEDARVVLFVGHQPTVGYVAHLLDDGHGDPDALDALLRGFPPASAAVFEVAVPWDALGAETGRLVAFRRGH